jgi:undecaprenyl-diphosphatase
VEIWGVPVVMGIVEGLTEFTPVSSTGHLIIVGHLLGFVGENASSFEVAIQFGAILSVVFLYWRRFVGLIPTHVAAVSGPGSNLEGWSGIWRIGVATVPALAVAYMARRTIEQHLFNPVSVTWALAIGGFAILIAEKFVARRISRSLETITLWQALGVGLFQVLALWPGTSRAAATIVGGMLLGLDRKGAAEFSFLIAVPIMLAAECYELLKMGSAFSNQDITRFAIGFVVSFVVAIVAVKGFVHFLSRWSLVPFAWYRIMIAPVFYWITRSGL